MLFSEPKIPQSRCGSVPQRRVDVSVLFSEPKIPQFPVTAAVRGGQLRFQCSSASRKFLNSRFTRGGLTVSTTFQCSSASRKFLNLSQIGVSRRRPKCFSALQRAENSSIWGGCLPARERACVSVLFSEPKIPQFSARFAPTTGSIIVSVLFSEPKIPQCVPPVARVTLIAAVSVLFNEPKLLKYIDGNKY